MNKKNNKLFIKVPVYISRAIERDKEDLHIFETTPKSMIADAEILIDKYNNSSDIVYTGKKSKSTTIGIKQIKCESMMFNEDPCLLLNVTSFKSNLLDGFFQSENDVNKQIRFKPKDQLCSDTNYFILYPSVNKDLENNKLYAYWHIFVYDDPSKDNYDMSSIARLLMREIVKVPIQNIKSEKLISELKKYRIISQVQIVMSSTSNDLDGIPKYMKQYSLSSKLKKEKKILIENMTTEDVLNTISDESFRKDFDKRQLKLITHNKRIFSMIQDFKDKLNSTIEDSFNYQIEVDEQDVRNGNIFKTDSIKKNIEGVFVNYLGIVV